MATRLPGARTYRKNRGEQGEYDQLRRMLNEALRAVVPPKGIIPFNLTAAELDRNFDSTGLGKFDYLGWAVCNGNNDTPSLNGKFPRLSTTAAGGTGGNDTMTTSSDGAHTHAVPAPDAGTQVIQNGAGANVAVALDTHTHTASSNGAHTHTGDNRPAYHELVPLMRLP